MSNNTIHYFKLSIAQKDNDSKKYINLTQQDIFKLFEEIYINKASYYSNPFKSLFLKDENLFFDFFILMKIMLL